MELAQDAELEMLSNSGAKKSEDSETRLGTLAVIGLGYIGLPTAVAFALRGWEVYGVDVSDRTLELVGNGELPFVEEGLDLALKRAVESGNFVAQKEIPVADVYVVAVPTPFTDNHSADLSYIDAVTDALSPKLKAGDLVVLESTSPPGTSEHMAERIFRQRPDLDLHGEDGKGQLDIAHAPERVLPGRIMIELAANDRIIGGITPSAGLRAREVYETFCTGTIHLSDARTAELAKLTENSFRDINIAFANELSIICDNLGIDVWELIDLANKHPRVNILRPGPGVGGHCIAVDPWFIVSADRDNSRLIAKAREVNDSKPNWVMHKFEERLAHSDSTKPVAILGLAFKPDIDDLRESPSVEISLKLAAAHPEVEFLVVEPNISELPASLGNLKNVSLSELTEALDHSGEILVLVGHREFRDLGTSLAHDSRVFDVCGVSTGSA